MAVAGADHVESVSPDAESEILGTDRGRRSVMWFRKAAQQSPHLTCLEKHFRAIPIGDSETQYAAGGIHPVDVYRDDAPETGHRVVPMAGPP